MKLEGQVALITGGGRGLGRATALALAREGANVVIADILEDRAAQTERDLNALGVESLGVVCDVLALHLPAIDAQSGWQQVGRRPSRLGFST